MLLQCCPWWWVGGVHEGFLLKSTILSIVLSVLSSRLLMNEWMMHFLYSALLCIVVHPNCFTIMWGWWWGSPQPPLVCSIHLDDATAATGQRRQCAYHTPATGGDERGPVVGIWLGHRGYTPTFYEKCHGIFNDQRESGPRFNISSDTRIKTAPDSQLFNLLSVSRLVAVLNDADDCGVICKLQELDRGVFRCVV